MNIKKIRTYPNPYEKFSINTYIVYKENTAIIIDPGFNSWQISSFIKENRLKVVGILLTHMHYDHIYSLNIFDVDIYVHENCLTRIFTDEYINLINRFRKAKVPLHFDFKELTYKAFKSDSVIKISDFTIRTLFTPGHSLGHSAFIINDTLFSGDCVFYRKVGKTTFDFGGDSFEQKRSVQRLLEFSDINLDIFPGHGKNTNIWDERKFNVYYLMNRVNTKKKEQ